MRKAKLVLLLLLLLGAGGYALYRRAPPPLRDQQQITNRILTATQALEQHRTKKFMAVIADDYYDGTYNKRDLESLVRSALLSADQIRVVPYLRSLDVQGGEAQAVVEAEVTVGRFQPGPFAGPSESGRYTVETTWRKGSEGWQVVSARGWQSAQEQFAD